MAPKGFSTCCLLLCWLAAVLGFQCPRSGFFPDPEQCDKYYECSRSKPPKTKLCKDGLVFAVHRSLPFYERCEYPFKVNCSKRPKLQPAQPSNEHCPRLNGLFEDYNADCGQYWKCEDGKATVQRCMGTLAFNPRSGTCQWPKNVPGCEEEEVSQPPVKKNSEEDEPTA